MKKIVYLFYFLLFTATSYAQQNFVLYNMPFIPQSVYANPAQIPASRINIGLPGISSFYTCFGNSGFKLDDLFKTTGGVTTYNVDGLIGNLKTNNYITTSVHIDLLSFGFKVKKNYFSFNLTEKADIWLRYPKAFLDFIWKGNGAFLGTQQNFNFGINATHYREWGFGYTRELTEKLTVGGRLKVLSGMENVWTAKSDVTFYTDPNDFSYKASSDILVNTSADTAGFNHFNASKYFLNFKNLGLGVDLGANYKLNDKFSFSASLIDLGYINWKSNTTNYQSKNPGAAFIYKGVGLSALGVDTVKFDKVMQKMTDSLSKTFDITKNNHNSYKTYLPAQMYVGANYSLNEKNIAGLLLYGQILDKTFRPGITLSMSSRVGKVLTSSLSYSIFNRSYGNVGFGFSLNIGPVQLYMVSDNVLGMILFNDYKTKDGSGFMAPAYAKYLNIRTGLNITLGRGVHDKDGDGVRDKEDDCPDTPGLKDFKGCPDKDGDRIRDKDDICPDVPGSPQFNGCPDTDGDGIKDIDDQCPNDKGPVFTKGCPDADNDSIKDADDECPQLAGPKYLKGCPDKDNDGIRDKDDKCPDKAGPADNNGCPVPKLIIIGSNGNNIDTILRNKDGEFIYNKLLADENVSFKLIDSDTDLKDINFILAGKSRKLLKDESGNFKFEKLEADVVKPITQQEDTLKLNFTTKPKPVVEVKLKEEEKKVLKTAFSSLEFENGKGILKETSFPSLTELAKLLKSKPDWMLRIAGHTDNVGNPKKNLELSKNRAEVVKKFMVLSGISGERVITEFYGSSKPIADNKTPQGRQKNRRVEMTVVQSAK
jgi:outer membrane protein OmpA-like peptidoglycan-associated protein